jgi:peptidoglycan/LPS O-acetylase OafA/YrhL
VGYADVLARTGEPPAKGAKGAAAAGAPGSSTTAKPAAERGFRPDIQGLRAIAVSLVVVYHLYPSVLPGGYVGVDVFFAISGFLITGHLLRTFERHGRVGFLDFYGRRARRLMPAAALVLTVTWLVARVALPATQLENTATQVRASALYFQNWALMQNATNYWSNKAPTPVQHFWSLSVEEQFYLFWPLLFLVASGVAWVAIRELRAGGASEQAIATRRALVGRGALFALGVAVVAASLWFSIHETRVNPTAAYYVTTTRIWELGIGGALALLARRVTRVLAPIGALGWAGLLAVVASAFVISDTSPFPGYIALLPVGGAVLLMACGSSDARRGPAWLTSLRPMVFLGDISYSLYLWHWPIIVLWKSYSGGDIGYLDGPAIAAVSVLLAWLTKKYVEDAVRLAPFITRSRIRSLGTVLAAAVPVTLVALFLASLPPAFNGKLDAAHPGGEVLATHAPVPAAAVVPPIIDAPNDGSAYASGPGGCQTPQQSSIPRPCTYGDTTSPTRTVALIGDSVAGQWFTDLNKLAVQNHWRLVMDLHSLCPWTATMLQLPSSQSQYTTCHTWGQTVMDDLLTKIKPDVVITSARPAVGTPDNPLPGAAAFAEIGKGMATYWKQLNEHDISVVAIRESPEMGKNIPDCLSSPRGSTSDCTVAASKAILNKTPLAIAAALDPNGVKLVDMNSVICTPTECPPIVGNVVVYRDSHHLTKTYTETIEPFLARKLLTIPALSG